ncbi:hypothetical protein HMPREF0022_02791 [Acinetobacter baumannii 6014059]|uniref:Uncharacterized protein n=1 Tax=Acinetobacter baumannii 6014059 TaxID=525242 RepID=A0A828SHK5_ACIBA|nr:hypothetical protein HMPREF0022_02791 [Acinetobacter baumannii 6014059]
MIVSTVKIHKNQIEWREKNVLRNLCRMICAGLAICEQIPNVLLAHTLPRSSQNYK